MLVPKVKEANNVKQFRPICLLNVRFKIFTWLMMERLTSFTATLLSPSQTAFTRGRHIVDGVVILHEIVHEIKGGVCQGDLQNRFRKAYHKVRWDFLEEVLTTKGFASKVKGWIMSTVYRGEGG
jgi:hypothetical protein